MTTYRVSTLRREVATFAAYLTGREPTGYLVSKYLEYHEKRGPACTGFDSALLALARIHPSAAFVCDSYATWFHRQSVLRKKLVVVIALYESTATGDAWLRSTDLRGSKHVLYAKLGLRIAAHVLAAVAGALLLSPVRLAYVRPGWRGLR